MLQLVSISCTNPLGSGASRILSNCSTNSGVSSATNSGTVFDSSLGLARLNTQTNTTEFSAAWTPQWNNLTGYWSFNGSGSVATGGVVPAVVGTKGVENAAGGTQISYVSAQLGQGLYFASGNSKAINVGDGTQYDYGTNSFSVSYWEKFDTGSVNPYWSMGKGQAYLGTPCGAATGVGTGGWGVAHWTTANPIQAQTYLSDGNTCLNAIAPSAYRGLWNHYVIVVDRSANTLTMYVNGIAGTPTSIATLGSLTNTSGSWAPLSFGRGAGSYGENLTLDEVAIWSSSLTLAQVRAIYDRQSAKFSGTLTSAIQDGCWGRVWNSLSAKTTLPFYKELPVSSGESSVLYSSLAGDISNGLLAYYPLNGTVGSIASGATVVDSVGSSNGTTTASGLSYTLGKLNQSVQFNTTTSISVPASAPANSCSAISIAFWVKWYASTSSNFAGLMSNWNACTTDPGWAFTQTGTTQGLQISINSVGHFNQYMPIVGTPLDGQWHHVVLTINSSGTEVVYIDGKQDVTGTVQMGSGICSPTAPITIGSAACQAGAYFNGAMDEIGIWSRPLSAAEVLQVYRRGANRVKYQVRSCANSDCSDQATAINLGWMGYDGTSLSAFSELQNNSSLTSSMVPTGTVNVSPLNLLFSAFNSLNANFSLGTNRYLQYSAILESDDSNSQCNYGAGAVACSPEIQGITPLSN